jgi:ketosteroid isomerase-like protein
VSTEAPELARRVFDALNRQDHEAFLELAHPEVEIRTARGVCRGLEGAAAWACGKYEHLARRYAVEELREGRNGILALVRIQYVWRETGEVGDDSKVAIALGFRDGKLVRWRLYEDPLEGLDELPD